MPACHCRLRLTSSGFLSGEVQLEGIEGPLNFIVDTGASVSVISDDVASNNGSVLLQRLKRCASSAPQALPTTSRPSCCLGSVSESIREKVSPRSRWISDTINEASGFEQAGILGGNFLRNYRMTFDFKNSKVTFVPISRKSKIAE
jgi:hypothetical protein